MAMASNPNEEHPDLLYSVGEFEPNNAFGCQNVRLPSAIGSYMVADIEQAGTGLEYHENVPLDDGHHFEAGFSVDTSPQWSLPQTNHAQWNSQDQPTEEGRAHSDRLSQLAVTQSDFPSLQESPALQLFENANDGRHGPGHPADHVRPQATMREEREIVDTRYISPYPTDLNRLFPQEDDAGNMAMQPQMTPLNFDFQHQADQAAPSTFSQPLIQQQSFAQIEGMVSGSSIYDQSMHVVSQQEETSRGVMRDGNPALVGLYGDPDSRSYAQDMGSAHFDPELSSDQMQGAVAAQSESFACFVCEKQYRNIPTLRYGR